MRIFSVLSLVLLAAVVVAGQSASQSEMGTVNDIMIGILFDTSNAVANAQYEDPEAPSDDFSFDPYGGWQRVEVSAIAMAESARLLAVPGRMCSNGEPAPVGESDWMGWAGELREAGMAAYAAAKDKSQERLAEMSDQLLASCTSCHTRYVDVGGDPMNRCRP